MKSERKPEKSLTLSQAWAFAIGTSIGWGSLVVTANTYLIKAGPAGSLLGLLIGAFVMVIISRNYAYMMQCYPGSGGAYTFVREAFGFDHGFLAAWFLALTYLAMLWANATSLPLFVRIFFEDLFAWGEMYTVFGYDVYLSEVLLSVASIVLAALLCAKKRRFSIRLMTMLVFLFSAGIIICFVPAFIKGGFHFSPAFVPDEDPLMQIIGITVISPWAFVGFESISHSSEEFAFHPRKSLKLFLLSVAAAFLLYSFIILLSVSACPPGYENWLTYISDLPSLSGIKALPAFYASYIGFGHKGTVILTLSLLGLIVTSLIGNIFALSRLFYSLGNDEILPKRYGELNEDASPENAIRLIVFLSVLVPLIGRTAIGWIVDVTAFGAMIVYAMVSAAAMKTASFRNDVSEKRSGLLGVIIMVCLGLYLLIPNLFNVVSIGTESLFLFTVWSALGFIAFRWVLQIDRKERFGKSIIVWIALLSLILFVSLVWMNRSILSAAEDALLMSTGHSSAIGNISLQEEMKKITMISARSSIMVVALFALSLGVLISNFDLLSRQVINSRMQLDKVRAMANKDPLTGVRSRLAYAEKEAEIERLISEGQIEAFGVAVCDVDGLKAINDTLGHKAGDEYIQRASRMICDHFDHSPVYRTGGDEFTVILSGKDYEAREEILKKIHEESVRNIGSLDAVVSAGTAEYFPGMTYREVFEKADKRMYEEKKLLKSLGAAARL